MTHIAVVTVNFNSEKETHDLLASLKKTEQKNFTVSIFVVDNASRVPFQLRPDEKKQKITLLVTDKNLGFTGGYNTGIQKALTLGADYILLLNNDTLVKPDFLEILLKTARENPEVGIIVPKIYFSPGHEFHKDRYAKNERGKVFWYAGGSMDWANVFSKHRGVDEVDHGQYDKIESIDFATGCSMFVPRIVLEKVGLLNDNLFLYYEDADFSQKVLRCGYKILYQPKAVIWHVNAASGGGAGSPLHDYYLTRNRMLFGMKYAPFRTKLALIRESMRLLTSGRQWQKKGILDFYMGRFGKGSFGV